MFRSKVFRDRAVARRSRPEPLDARLQVTAPHEWMALAGLGIALLVLLLWGVFGTVQRSVAASAVLVQPGERFTVASPVSGVVVERLAEVGDAVAAGQAIARVRLPVAERQAQITRRLIGVVEDELPGVDAADAGVRRQLLVAARDELREAEQSVAEMIVAPRDGWLASSRLQAGQVISVGDTVAQVRVAGDGAWQAYAFVSPADAGQVTAGMAAQALAEVPGEPVPQVLSAEVLEVSPRPVEPPPWLEDLGLAGGAPWHLLRLALHEPVPAGLADGVEGSARVMLVEQSLASALLSRGSG